MRRDILHTAVDIVCAVLFTALVVLTAARYLL